MGSPRQAQHNGSTLSCRNALSNGFDICPGKNHVASMVRIADLTAAVVTNNPIANLTGDSIVNVSDLVTIKSIFFQRCAP